ncbi:TatD family hydrolase [Corynebacterium glyciniphilum]|uniref:Deoxyribonuclease n=1 Tax=Corynebacterium glyciniphilum AJ 3170 TaxID=1404245 RepID=X5DK11_9CORY|nr:TatD family hydrolase [Corynebacterium glyciniphilum]AHW63438.1 Deoxyribonuclease [Corynebacterium glyciniphilum AJ 3170]
MSRKKPRPTPVPPEPLAEVFDAHTHLASCGAGDAASVRAIMDRAAAAGVSGVCTVGDGIGEAELALEAAHADERVVAACAVHPTKAHELTDDVRTRLRGLVADDRCVAVGETGLDTYWITHDPEGTAPLGVQEEALRWHMDLAAEFGKPLMIHNREADEDLMRVLADAPAGLTVMLHCFSSPLDVALEAVDRGYYLSFCGNVTFKRNEELRQAAARVPEDRILVETDAPYMTPEPFRGARNEPTFVGYTARLLAEVRGVDPDEFGVALSRNARRLYGLTM